MPHNMSIRFTGIARTNLLKEAGSPVIARKRTKMSTPTIMEKIMTVALPVSKTDFLKSVQFNLPANKAMKKVPVAPAPPASVGVKTPV